MIIDTHCHIHQSDYPLDKNEVMERAKNAGVGKVICVGTDTKSSKEALEFAAEHENAYATIGVHPHEASGGIEGMMSLIGHDKPPQKLVAIGEIGLDYYYNHSPREAQIRVLEEQIDLALRLGLPISFHVREAFSDLWPIIDNFKGIRGVLHSFTDTHKTMEQALERGLFIGVNGISTFTKDRQQIDTFRQIPPDKLLVETDAPFLTPVPYRGKVNEPAFVKEVAAHHARIREMSLDELSVITSANADTLFST